MAGDLLAAAWYNTVYRIELSTNGTSVLSKQALFSSVGTLPLDVTAVSDTGPGLAQADIDRIFREFEQAEGGRTRRHGGAGLGLAISRRIVEAMKGTIAVESEPGVGTTFTVTIPLAEVSGADLLSMHTLSGMRVLILSRNGMETEAIARTIDAASERLAAGGRLIYLGAGTSGRIATQDAAELPPTYNWPYERALTLMAGGETALLGLLHAVTLRKGLCRFGLAPGRILDTAQHQRLERGYQTPVAPGIHFATQVQGNRGDTGGRPLPGSKDLLHVAVAEAGGEVSRVVATEGLAPVAAGPAVAFGQDPRAGLQVRADLERALVARPAGLTRLHRFDEDPRHDLPRHAEAILEPAARPLLASVGQSRPEVVDLVLVPAQHL
jgi:hypothetical protein